MKCNVCHALLQLAAREGDSPEERERTELLLPASVVIAPMCLFSFFSNYVPAMVDGTSDPGSGGSNWSNAAGMALIGFTCLELVVGALCGYGMPMNRCSRAMLQLALAVLLWDYPSMVDEDFQSRTAWPLNVIVLDVLLVINADPRLSMGVCSAVVVWLVFKSVFIKCADAGGVSPLIMVGAWATIAREVVTLVLDFHFTRGFAQRLREQMRANDASVELAEDVAVLLAGYETGRARGLVGGAGDALPPRLRSALHQLLVNLEVYRPFLPHSVLSCGAEGVGQSGLRRLTQICDIVPDVGDSSSSSTWSESKKTWSRANSASPTSISADTPPAAALQRRDSRSPPRSPLPPAAGGPWEAGCEQNDGKGVFFISATTGAVGKPESGRRRSGALGSPTASQPDSEQRMPGNCASQSVDGRRAHGKRARAETVRTVKSGVPRVMSAQSHHQQGPQPAPQQALIMAPMTKTVTLLNTNRCQFLGSLQQTPTAAVSMWYALEIEYFSDSVIAHKGVVDLFVGDHLFATFGAVRTCLSHREEAVGCAARVQTKNAEFSAAHKGTCAELAGLAVTAAACSGLALCGALGSSQMQRTMVVGGLSCMTAATERLAVQWSVPLLADDSVHTTIEHSWYCRVRQRVVYKKRGSSLPLLLWQIIGAMQCDRGNMEWMYQLASAAPNPWQSYNDAVQLWAGGLGMEAKQLLRAARFAPAEEEIRQSLQDLYQCITETMMPSIELVEVAMQSALSPGSGGAPPGPDASGGPVSVLMSELREQESRLQSAREADRRQQQQSYEKLLRGKTRAAARPPHPHPQPQAAGPSPVASLTALSQQPSSVLQASSALRSDLPVGDSIVVGAGGVLLNRSSLPPGSALARGGCSEVTGSGTGRRQETRTPPRASPPNSEAGRPAAFSREVALSSLQSFRDDVEVQPPWAVPEQDEAVITPGTVPQQDEAGNDWADQPPPGRHEFGVNGVFECKDEGGVWWPAIVYGMSPAVTEGNSTLYIVHVDDASRNGTDHPAVGLADLRRVQVLHQAQQLGSSGAPAPIAGAPHCPPPKGARRPTTVGEHIEECAPNEAAWETASGSGGRQPSSPSTSRVSTGGLISSPVLISPASRIRRAEALQRHQRAATGDSPRGEEFINTASADDAWRTQQLTCLVAEELAAFDNPESANVRQKVHPGHTCTPQHRPPPDGRGSRDSGTRGFSATTPVQPVNQYGGAGGTVSHNKAASRSSSFAKEF